MRPYDPTRPLIGLHIPKCAGSSMKQVLSTWFGWRLHWHYFDERANRMPARPHLLRRLLGALTQRGPCIYGHFNRARGFGIEEYYPDAEQFFTVLRDPLAVVCSRYFAAKQQGARCVRAGQPAPIADRYPSLDAFIAANLTRPFLVNYLPSPLTLAAYGEIFATRFVYVGVAEDLPTSIAQLAVRLGFTSPPTPHANTSRHDETLDPALAAAFEQSRPLEYAIYHYALEHYRDDSST